ncbi:MAG: hypothetical protein MUE40_20325 [Anaerolineae bacterium]|nr:hypothetical protein [Anaerolineae bacterium]
MSTTLDSSAANLTPDAEALVRYCQALFNERNPRLNAAQQTDLVTLYEAAVRFQKKSSNAMFRLSQNADEAILQRMRHDLKNELNIIIGFSRLMLREIRSPLTPLQYATMSTIYQAGMDLVTLVDTLR